MKLCFGRNVQFRAGGFKKNYTFCLFPRRFKWLGMCGEGFFSGGDGDGRRFKKNLLAAGDGDGDQV